jgi:hypothetical protein
MNRMGLGRGRNCSDVADDEKPMWHNENNP